MGFHKKKIPGDLDNHQNVLLTAHGNSLRSIVMFIDNLTSEEVLQLEIPTGDPLFCEYKKHKLE